MLLIKFELFPHYYHFPEKDTYQDVVKNLVNQKELFQKKNQIKGYVGIMSALIEKYNHMFGGRWFDKFSKDIFCNEIVGNLKYFKKNCLKIFGDELYADLFRWNMKYLLFVFYQLSANFVEYSSISFVNHNFDSIFQLDKDVDIIKDEFRSPKIYQLSVFFFFYDVIFFNFFYRTATQICAWKGIEYHTQVEYGKGIEYLYLNEYFLSSYIFC